MSEVAATGISVLLVDDHPIVRQGLALLIDQDAVMRAIDAA